MEEGEEIRRTGLIIVIIIIAIIVIVIIIERRDDMESFDSLHYHSLQSSNKHF